MLLKQILENLTTQLERLFAYLKIEFTNDNDIPVVVDIIDPAPVLDAKWKEKIDKEIKPEN